MSHKYFKTAQLIKFRWFNSRRIGLRTSGLIHAVPSYVESMHIQWVHVPPARSHLGSFPFTSFSSIPSLNPRTHSFCNASGIPTKKACAQFPCRSNLTLARLITDTEPYLAQTAARQQTTCLSQPHCSENEQYASRKISFANRLHKSNRSHC